MTKTIRTAGTIIVLVGLAFAAYRCHRAQQHKEQMIEQYEQHLANTLSAWENNDCQAVRDEFSAAREIGEKHDLILGAHTPDLSVDISGVYDYCGKALQVILPRQGEPSRAHAALLEYYDLFEEIEIETRGQDNDTLAKMKQIVQPRIVTIFGAASPAEFADEAFCLRVFGLYDYGLIADPDVHLPLFYATCAEIFFATERYGEAVSMYRQLLQDYPDHESAENATEHLTEALMAEVNYKLDGPFSGLGEVSTGGRGNPVVTIQNDAYRDLHVNLDGVETQRHVLDPCKGCQPVYGATAKEECVGPTETFEIKPGIYQVSANPYGLPGYEREWRLKTGTAYYICFYVTRSEQIDFSAPQ